MQELIKKIIKEQVTNALNDMVNSARPEIEITDNQYYIVRSHMAGVFFGKIVSRSPDGILVMDDCRKIHYWNGAGAIEQLAVDGVSKPIDCRITVAVNGSIINGWIQILPCTEKSVASLKGVPCWIK